MENGEIQLYPTEKNVYDLLVEMKWVDSLMSLQISKELAPCLILVDKNMNPIDKEWIVLYDNQGNYYKNNESRK